MRSGLYGFIVAPNRQLEQSKASIVCGMLVLTNGTAPAFLRTRAMPESSSTGCEVMCVKPMVVS